MATKGTKGSIGRGGRFVAPPPRGVRLAEPVPRSTQYVPPEPDPDEEAAFTRTPRPRRRATEDGLTPAQLRMRGRVTHETDPEDEEDGELDFDMPDPEPEIVKVQAVPPPAATTHPISPFPMTAAPPRAAAVPDGAVFADSVEGLRGAHITAEDIDRLWDWLRSDKDYGFAFVGRTFNTSLALHVFMTQMSQAETQGVALIRALHYHEHHLGFAMLAPILAQERTALMHVYLQPAVRGQLAQFIRPLVEIAQKTAPGVHLAVPSMGDDAYTRLHRQLLKPLGFQEHVMFIL